MFAVSGLLSIYALPQLKLRLAAYHDDLLTSGKVKSSNGGLIGITDSSSTHETSKMEQEIKQLKIKALSLEMAFRRMVNHFFPLQKKIYRLLEYVSLN